MRPTLLLLASLTGCNGAIGDRAIDHDVLIDESDPTTGCTGLCVGKSRLARLTRPEYATIVRAALGDEVAGAIRPEFLPPDDAAGPFTSNEFLAISPEAVAQYDTMAALLAERAKAHLSEILDCDPALDEDACAEETIRRVGRVLFRRSLTADEAALYTGAFREDRAESSFEDALELLLTAILQSPYFVYRVEVGIPTEVPGVMRLTGREVATRLALFLWNGGPDDELLDAADAGVLDTEEGVAMHARRMFDDPRADGGLEAFFAEWLGVAEVASRDVDTDAFPSFATFAPHLAVETTSFGLEVLRSDEPSLRTLLTARWTIADEELAPFYGSARPDSNGVLALDETRAGILTHGSFLASHGDDPTTQAVQRGKAIRQRLLCRDLPPPIDVDTVIASDPTRSARQRLEEKTSPEACRACHRLMNPLGFAFLHYDMVGAYRETDGEHAIDATGIVDESDVTEGFDGAIELSSLLAESEDVQRCMARQWVRYALGRTDTRDDAPSIARAYEVYAASDYDLRELVVAVTRTDAFRHRRLPE
jgi:hypothetical protein